MSIRDRVLALLGLNFDFSVDLGRKAISQIDETLFVGRRPHPEEVQALKSVGITHIVSCLPQSEHATMAFLACEFEPLFLPIHDGIHEDISAALTTMFEFAQTALSPGAKAKLLVHCEVGVSRSATMAIAWVMKSKNKNFYDAFQEVRAQRLEVLPNIGFASQLQQLEHSLHPALRSAKTSSLTRYLRDVCKVPLDAETLQGVLERQNFDAPNALRCIFGDEIPRVVQGVRL